MAKRKWTQQEVQEYRNAHGTAFYFNKEDSNIFVPKAFGFGFSFNWANPLSWLVLLVLIGIIIGIKIIR